MRYPTVFTLKGLFDTVNMGVQSSSDGRHYYPARPHGFASPWYRVKAAWLVFTGRADAVVWPDDQ